jgi:hypothetical protein
MPWIYVEDWSLDIFVKQIAAELPHQEILLKVFAMEGDPRKENVFACPNLFAEEASGAPFSPTEVFQYGERSWTGADLEDFLQQTASRPLWENARALFRFSHENGFTEAAMLFQVEGVYRFNHPMVVIDGLDHLNEQSIHLDIFFPTSVRALTNLMSVSESTEISDLMKGSKWRRKPRFKY